MRNSKFIRSVIGAILVAYIATGIISPRGLQGQALFLKLEKSFSVRNELSIVLDGRPYWTSHKHLIPSEKFSGDYALRTPEPLMGAITPERTVEILAAFIPTSTLLFSSNHLRAPPLS
jgi:hypothetical protein